MIAAGGNPLRFDESRASKGGWLVEWKKERRMWRWCNRRRWEGVKRVGSSLKPVVVVVVICIQGGLFVLHLLVNLLSLLFTSSPILWWCFIRLQPMLPRTLIFSRKSLFGFLHASCLMLMGNLFRKCYMEYGIAHYRIWLYCRNRAIYYPRLLSTRKLGQVEASLSVVERNPKQSRTCSRYTRSKGVTSLW